MTTTIVRAEPTACERAIVALLQARGVRVPIEVVDGRQAYLAPPTSPVVRVSQEGDSWVTPFEGGSKSRTGNLLAAKVRIAGYGIDAPDIDRGIKDNPGRAHVKQQYRYLTEDIDLLEITIQRGPKGQVGALRAWSLVAEPAILSAAPPVPRGHGEVWIRALAASVAGEIQRRVPGNMPYAGEVSIDTEVAAEVADEGQADADGLVERKIVLHVEAWPMQNRGSNLAEATRRAVQVLDTLNGRAFPSIGRVSGVRIGDPVVPEDVNQVSIRAELDVMGWRFQ